MGPLIGIKNFFTVVPAVPFTTNIVPATVGLNPTVAANQNLKLRAWVPFTVGATGGIRMTPVVPAGGTSFVGTAKIFNTVAPSITTFDLAANTPITAAVANAGQHWMEIELDIQNGATAGVVDLQFAQNTSDANTLTILKGGSADVTKF